MFFLCSRCSRDLFKTCKVFLDVDICDECIKLKKSCDVFIFENICKFRTSMCFMWFSRFSKKRFENEKIKFHVEIENTFVEYFVESQEIQSLYSRQKKIRDDLFSREFNFRRLLIKQSRFVQCFKLLKRRKTILSCKNNVFFFVLTRSMILLSSILSKCISQSFKKLSLSQYR